ncbi:hypothetical protein H0H92_013073 [Tricholoma furcatifolium]|nr:hypothetical protein H0H92_013073 [Tricholoma furcatifolium]
MTPLERAILQRVGASMLQNLSSTTITVLLQGVYNVIFIVYLLHIRTKGLSARATKILFSVSLSCFLCNLANIACKVYGLVLFCRGFLIDSEGTIDIPLIDAVDNELMAPLYTKRDYISDGHGLAKAFRKRHDALYEKLIEEAVNGKDDRE